MDRLDKQIMAAKKQYAPSKDFTKSTMRKISNNSAKQSNFNWLKTFTLSGVALVAIFVVGFTFLYKDTNNSQKPSDTVATNTNPTTSPQTATQTLTSAQTTANEINTDLAQLDKEVSGYTVSYPDSALDNLNQ